MLEDRLVGLMSLFARDPLTRATLQEMASVANGIALCIERKRSAEALDASEVRYRSVVENIKEVIFQINERRALDFPQSGLDGNHRLQGQGRLGHALCRLHPSGGSGTAPGVVPAADRAPAKLLPG